MRSLFFALALGAFAALALVPGAHAQTAPLVEVADTDPQLIGGLAGLQARVQYPAAAREAGQQGTVFVQFIVDENGVPTDLQIVRGVAESLNAEALRAVREARFTPAAHEGKPARVMFTLPIRFVLPTDDSR